MDLKKESLELEKLLDIPVAFGLQAQGLIPAVEKMLAEGRSWEEIGKAIGWQPGTLKRHWEMTCTSHTSASL